MAQHALRIAAPTAARFALTGLLCGVLVCACKSREHALAAPSHTPAPSATNAVSARVESTAAPLPPERAFEQPDDEPSDPAEALREMRHDCCDEMPAAEVEAAIRAEPKSPGRKASSQSHGKRH